MPHDRYGELDDAVDLDNEPELTPADKAWAVVNCELCDEYGYRGSVVCDHVDRTESNRRGLEKCWAVLNRKKSREAS